MLNKFKIITLSHHQSNPEDVKHVLLPSNSGAEDLKMFKAEYVGIEEALYLATCNRVIYFFVTHTPIAQLKKNLYQFLQRTQDDSGLNNVWPKVQTLQGIEAIKHYICVAASMDSLVIGEREIFRQLRTAYDSCLSEGITGDHLRLVQQSTVKAAKRIYSESRIGDKPISVVSLAMRKFLGKRIPTDDHIILIGAGTTIDTVSKFLHKSGYQNVSVYNRSIANASLIANHLGSSATPYTLENLPEAKPFRAIISCTGSLDPIVTKELYAEMVGDDPSLKIIIDLAVPEDIELSIFDKFPTERISINDLRKLADANHEFRRKELQKANHILDDEIREIGELFHRRFIERAFATVPVQVQEVKQRALEQVFKKELDEMDDHAKDLILRMMDYMEKKCVAIPMKTAKEQYTLIKKSLSSEYHSKHE